MNYFDESTEKVLSELETSVNGLTSSEAESRLSRYGKNEITEQKKKGVLRVFAEQFADLLVIILIVSALVSVFTGNVESAIVIVCVITMNAVLGTIQHFKAEKSLDALKSMSSPTAKVMRDNNIHIVNASDITVGDIVLVEQGDIVSADGRLISCASLQVNESSLTGESNGIEKFTGTLTGESIPLGDRKNMVYTGSLVTAGRGTFVVTSVGMNTELGKIAGLINKAERKKTPLQRSLDKFSKQLSIAIPVLCLIVMILYIVRGTPILDSLMFAVALAVAAIPEALSSIVTIALAIGTRKMAEQNAVIKDLKAVEGLGCVSVICSDKTGTLTQNKMTVRRVYLSGKEETAENITDGPDCELLRKAMALCNDAVYTDRNVIGDPTETALSDFVGMSAYEKLRLEYPRVSEIPFDSDRKLMSTCHTVDGRRTMFTKGATDSLLSRLVSICDNGVIRPITESDKTDIVIANERFSGLGMRVLAFAYKISGNEQSDTEDNYIFIGLSAMTDPPRPESKTAVANCIRAGIKPVMITGDHKVTASAIAREIGIMSDGDISLEGTELDKMSDEELDGVIEKVSVYARVSPDNKIRIVEHWQNKGRIVAMTGDGVNDAPALKKADVGVAMGITGTQVSKDAASMILTDDNFATIIKSVANGRAIYANIKNAVKFLLSGNLAAIIAVLCTAIPGLPAPFTAVQLLFINLLTDSLPAIAISTEKADKSLLSQKPRNIGESFLTKAMSLGIAAGGVLIALAVMMSYFIGSTVSAELACAMAFSTLCIARLFHGFNCRSDKSIFRLGITTNKFSLLAFVAGMLFLVSALFIPGLSGLFTAQMMNIEYFRISLAVGFAPTLLIQAVRIIKEFFIKKK
ncbi:MAG: cation-translocating P-type ATPase [Ruminiclostridium sp.]|nr:cation-translocating P-type ATPase [Ruminiclostridium sp.]